MTESQTTLEEASRCSRCGEPGKQTGQRPVTSGSGKILEFTCMNSRCRWYNTVWPVQVSANGTIPITLQRPKQFRPLPDDGGRTLQGLQAQLAQETSKEGGEIRGRG